MNYEVIMISILSKLFIKDHKNYSDEKVRTAYGMLSGFLGIGLNILLFLLKYFAGVISGSIAITADAFNNLTDSGSSLITLFGFRLAAQKPDTDHPFGHGRIEYLSGVFVSMIIVVVGVELGIESLDKIRNPVLVEASFLAISILALSIAVKFYMYFYNMKLGKLFSANSMVATGKDSIGDCLSTSVVLICMLINKYFSLNLDAYGGLFVSAFIIYMGFNSAMETIDPLLGKAPSLELINSIEAIVMAHAEIINMHDLIVHDYGPGRLMISLHAEVSDRDDILALHDTIDNIEHELMTKLKCQAVIHMDPVSSDDSKTTSMRQDLIKNIKRLDERISIHDFRIVDGATHTNVIFDALVPYESFPLEADARKSLENIVNSLWDNCHPKITIDRPYV